MLLDIEKCGLILKTFCINLVFSFIVLIVICFLYWLNFCFGLLVTYFYFNRNIYTGCYIDNKLCGIGDSWGCKLNDPVGFGLWCPLIGLIGSVVTVAPFMISASIFTTILLLCFGFFIVSVKIVIEKFIYE